VFVGIAYFVKAVQKYMFFFYLQIFLIKKDFFNYGSFNKKQAVWTYCNYEENHKNT